MSIDVDQHPATSSGPLRGLAVYTMFRGELAQLVQWCNFHLNADASRLYVVLDCPGDDLVAALPADPRVHWEVAAQRMWDRFYPPASQNVERKQVDGFRWMARRATADGHTHLAFVDVDELLALAEPFASIVGRYPDAAAITVPVREMWYAEGDPAAEPFGATLALRRSPAGRRSLTRAFGWRAQFLRNGLMGHDAGKSIYRLPPAAGELSVHRPLSAAMKSASVNLPAARGKLLHFDCGSVTTWNAKWGARLAGGTVAAGLFPHRRAQQRLFAHVLRKAPEDQQAFFRRFFSVDREAEAVLKADGLAERVDVRDRLCGPLAAGPVPAGSAGSGLIRLPDAGDRVDFQFAMVCDKRFVKPTFATMASVLAQIGDKGSVRFVVLGDGLDTADVSQLCALEHTAFDVRVAVHDITADLDRDVGTEDAKRATFGRVYLIDYLPEQRTVYLDGDVLATRDFTELFELDLGSACLAGVPDSAALRIVANPTRVPIQQRNRLMGITGGDPLEYLNGGVLIFDLDNPDFRGLALEARSLVAMGGRAMKQRDQDALNIAFAGRKHRLESTYNYMTQFYVSDRCLDGDLVQRKYKAADASLIHFSGKIKPWESPDDEFYNGLYRQLVVAAEERVGVSCEFYFSNPELPARRHWTAQRWADVLGSVPGRPAPPDEVADISLVDLCDAGAYLQISPRMYERALAAGLRLVVSASGSTLAEIPLDRLGPQRAHAAQRAGAGVRMLRFDLTAALSSHDGVARHVELALAGPGTDGEPDFVRVFATVDLVAAGPAASAGLLVKTGADGAVEALAGGRLSGWYRPRAAASDEPVSLYIDGDLVEQRQPDVPRPDRGEGDRIRGFEFNVALPLQIRHGRDREIAVRLAGTNVPLRGTPVRVSAAGRRMRYDAARDLWVGSRRGRRPLRRRIRRRVKRVLSRVRPDLEGTWSGANSALYRATGRRLTRESPQQRDEAIRAASQEAAARVRKRMTEVHRRRLVAEREARHDERTARRRTEEARQRAEEALQRAEERRLADERKAQGDLLTRYDEKLVAIIEQVKARTMTGPAKLAALIEATRHVERRRIPGEIVECGVWRGGSMQAVALTLLSLGETDRELHLFDTFEGMPPPTAHDTRTTQAGSVSATELLAASDKDSKLWAVAGLDEVRKAMAETGYPADKLHYHPGMVEDTTPGQAPAKIAILRLDTDWYASTKHELECLYERLSPGGLLILDDYGDWDGARRATDDWLMRTGEPLFLAPMGSGRIAIKPPAPPS